MRTALYDEQAIITMWYEEYPDANPRNAEELLDVLGIVFSDSSDYYEAIVVAENVLQAHEHCQEEHLRWTQLQREHHYNFYG